ncbi:MAG: hypothetical protein A2X51_13130 [Candidatus Rokubacteria bacterium GWC2_70_24]|nr:MAG: hypothetical protein A2X53_01100 [Candidatus Rokubacteria bacterium GWA2_70_23]OGK89400.1 MAG: hypothetical protein A2X51_13130 [Candidatus Rokubacteria bacterium GWC2_70_24]OGK90991.1 MAG: hypothetical protein A2X50_03180 [Candidatus Rokubacteria bacterium GWF2_70_14]
MRAALLGLGLLAVGCSPPAPQAVAVDVSCVPESRPLRRLCTVRITDRQTGAAVRGATVTLHADMPSMPMAHSVPPAPAAPGAEPGVYRGVVELEMRGRWVVAVRIAGPVNDQVTHTIDIE